MRGLSAALSFFIFLARFLGSLSIDYSCVFLYQNIKDMRFINIPSPSVLNVRGKGIRAIIELYGYVKEIFGCVPEDASEANLLVNSESLNLALSEAIAEKDAQIKKANSEIYTLKQAVGNLGGKVTYEYPDAVNGKSLGSLLLNNGTVRLTEDATSTSRIAGGVIASNKTTLSLNGKTLTFTGNSVKAVGAILLRGSQEFTVSGAGSLVSTEESPLIWCSSKNAVVTLGGSAKTVYQGNNPSAELVYCEYGTINITGGVYKNSGSRYLLNCKDANYRAGTAKIVVTGGKFYDFNPADNLAEGAGTSFVAEGYKSVASTVAEDGVEHTVYTVSKA